LVVESTFNRYWLADGLMDAGYHNVHLANLSAMKQYEGLKYSGDQHDVFWGPAFNLLASCHKGTFILKKASFA